MNKYYYKHLSNWERRKIESLIGNKPILKPIFGSTNHGWDIVNCEWLVDINQIAFILNRSRKTIKRELLNGRYETLINNINKNLCTFSYSADVSRFNRIKKYKTRNKKRPKIFAFPKLRGFIIKELKNNQSLKSIAERSKIAYQNNEIEQPISIKTLYSYIDNENVLFINRSCLKRERKHKYRIKNYCKRQNGISISERPNYINNIQEFGHWEMDFVIGNKKTNVNLLTLYERKSKLGIAIKIHGKEASAITKTLKYLQNVDKLIYGVNVKSITTDNGSEFYDWKEFRKSLYNAKDDVDVYFCHSYASWEKGGVENFNWLIRKIYPKGFDFSTVSQYEIDNEIKKINGIYRESLMFKSANENYNELCQISLCTLN